MDIDLLAVKLFVSYVLTEAYARYSSDNQRETSAEEQVRFCREFINSHGYIYVDEYVDKEKTGTNANRKKFQKMLDDSKKRLFDVVVVYKNDRFARDVYDKAISKRKLLVNGVVINYVKEDILNNDTPEAVIFESVSDGMAAFYSKNLAREVMEKGLLPNAQKCMHNGGIPPLGLSVVNQRYIINEDEAIIVKQIFDWYINKDYGYDKIAQTLNDNGFLNKRGTPFKGTGIRDLLLNEKYIGTYIYNRRSGANALGKRNNSKDKPQEEIVLIEDAFPAIIDIDIFNKVKSIMNNRKGRNTTHQAQEVYLLSGIAKCGKCGSNMHGNKKRTNRDKSHHITYKCNKRDRLGKKVCNCKELNKLYVERAIMHYISQMCEGNNLKLIMKELKEYAKSQSDTSQDEALLKKRLSKAEKEIANIINAITKGFDADELKAQYSSLKEQKQDYQSKLAILEAQALRNLQLMKLRQK